MGNKSKTNGAKQSVKWAQRRDLAKARQPKKWNQWGGMAAPRLAAVVSAVGIGATETERAHPLRQRHSPQFMRRVG